MFESHIPVEKKLKEVRLRDVLDTRRYRYDNTSHHRMKMLSMQSFL
jgi:hypothetical protein